MRHAYDKPTTRIVSCKSNLQLAYDYRVRHEKCRRILKHVLKPYDMSQLQIKDESCIRFLRDASSARYKSRMRQNRTV